MPPPWIHKPKKPYYSNSSTSSIGNNPNFTIGPPGNSNNNNVGFGNSPSSSSGGITSSISGGGNHYRPSPTNIEEGEISSPRYSNNSGTTTSGGGPLYSSRKFFPPNTNNNNSNRSLNRGSNTSSSVNNNSTSTVLSNSNINNNNNNINNNSSSHVVALGSGGGSSSSHHHEDGEISTSPTNGMLSYQGGGGGERGKSHYNRSYNNFNRRNYHNDFHRSNSNSTGGGGGGISINSGPPGDRFPNTLNSNPSLSSTTSAPPNITGVGGTTLHHSNNPSTNITPASSLSFSGNTNSSLTNNNNNNSSSSFSGVPSLPVGSYAALSETASGVISNTPSTLTQKWEPPPSVTTTVNNDTSKSTITTSTSTTTNVENMLIYDWRKTKATTIAISSEKGCSSLSTNPTTTTNTAGPFSAAPPPSYHDSNNFVESSSLNSNTNHYSNDYSNNSNNNNDNNSVITHSKWEQPSSSYNRNNRFDRETYYGSRKHFRGRSLGNNNDTNHDVNSVGGGVDSSSLNNNSNTTTNTIIHHHPRDPRNNNFSSFRKNSSGDRNYKWENRWSSSSNSANNSLHPQHGQGQGLGQSNDSSSTQPVDSISNTNFKSNDNYYGPSSSSPIATTQHQSGNQNDGGYRKGGGTAGGSYDETTESSSSSPPQQQLPTLRKKFSHFGYNTHHNSTMPRFKPPPGVKQNVFTPPHPNTTTSNNNNASNINTSVPSIEDREQFQQQSQHRNNFKTSTYIIGGGSSSNSGRLDLNTTNNSLESSNSSLPSYNTISDRHPSHRDVRRTPSFNTDDGNHPPSSQSDPTLHNDDSTTTTTFQHLKPSSSNDANQDIDSKNSMDQSEQEGGNTNNDNNNDKDEKNQRPLSPLTVASLGNKDNAAKAAKVIRRLSSLNISHEYDEKLMNESLDSVILPSTEEIFSGLSELELKIKERQDESAQIRADLKRIKEMEEKRLRQSMTDEPKDSVDSKSLILRSDKEDDDQMEEEETVEDPGGSKDTKVDNDVNIEKQELIIVDAVTRKQERKEIEVELTLVMDSLKELNENRTKKEDEMKESIDKAYEAELAQITADYHTLCKENSNLVDKASSEFNDLQSFLKDLESTSKSIGKSIDDIDCDIAEEEGKKTKLIPIHEEKLIDASEVLQKKMGTELSDSMKSILYCCKDSKEEMNNVIITVLSENHIRVKQSHHDALLAIPFDHEYSTSSTLHSSVSLPGLITEPYVTDEDDRGNESFHKWSNMARNVSGPGDALYTEPSETLLYDDIEKNHEEMKLLVREHVRAKRRKLFKYWTGLAQEYMYRKTRYSKDNQGDASKSSVDPVSGPVSILGKRKENPIDNSASVEMGGGTKGNSNPYRRPRRGEASTSGFGTSDIVRTEYEQEQIIAQLTANDAMEKRIKLGGSKLPRQRCHLEKDLFVSYHDRFSHRYVEDFLHEENERRYVNPWSDVEKCIFFDKFLQHPKDFRKIASFLRNKTTHDCISFYYDSKQTVPYKAALKEYISRTKKRGEITSWDATVQAALSVGASISDGSSPEKPLIFSLPKNDNTYHTLHMHPLSANLLDNTETEDIVEDPASEIVNKLSPSKSKQTCRTLFSYERKFVKSKPLNILQKDTNSSDGENTNPIEKSFSSSENISENVSPSDAVKQINSKKDAEKPTSSKTTTKWTKEEKVIFSKNFEQHGKNWQLLAESLATKTIPQIKRYYHENKKQFSKKRLGNTSTKEFKAIKSENSQVIESHVPTPFKENSSRLPNVVKLQDDDNMQIERHLNIVQEQPLYDSKPSPPESLNQSLQSRFDGAQSMDSSFLHTSDQWSQRQLEWVLEQHRHRLTEQQIQQLNQQRQLELAQYQQQQQQRLHQQQHSQHLQSLLARNHLDFLHASGHNQHGLSNLQMTSWLTAQHMNLRASLQRQQQQEGHIRDWGLEDENARIQNTIAAVRQAAQRQHNGYNLGMASLSGINHNHNDVSSNNNRVQNQGVSYNSIGRGDLDLLARMAADASRNNNSERKY